MLNSKKNWVSEAPSHKTTLILDESCGDDGDGGSGTGSKIDKDGKEIDRATQSGIGETVGVRWRCGAVEDTQDSTE